MFRCKRQGFPKVFLCDVEVASLHLTNIRDKCHFKDFFTFEIQSVKFVYVSYFLILLSWTIFNVADFPFSVFFFKLQASVQMHLDYHWNWLKLLLSLTTLDSVYSNKESERTDKRIFIKRSRKFSISLYLQEIAT